MIAASSCVNTQCTKNSSCTAHMPYISIILLNRILSVCIVIVLIFFSYKKKALLLLFIYSFNSNSFRNYALKSSFYKFLFIQKSSSFLRIEHFVRTFKIRFRLEYIKSFSCYWTAICWYSSGCTYEPFGWWRWCRRSGTQKNKIAK